jgi:hypothetical protein
MVAFDILTRTFDDIIEDLGTSLKISLPFLLALGLVVGGLVATGLTGFLTADWADAPLPDGSADFALSDAAAVAMAALILLGVPLLAVGFCSSAVAWHRYAMLGERPKGWLPASHGGLTGRYLWVSFLLFLLIILVHLLPLLMLGTVADTDPDGMMAFDAFALPYPLTAMNFGLALLFSFMVGGFILRLSVVLPALAVDRRIGFRAALRQTGSDDAVVLFGSVSVLMMLAFGIMDFVTGLAPDLGILGLMTLWIQIIVGIGVLTRLYMHVTGDSRTEDPQD